MSEISNDGQGEDNSLKKSKDVVALWDDTYREYEPLLSEMEEDFRFRLGDQWNDTDKSTLAKDGRPILSLNTCKKACDIITGYQRQNAAAIRVLPVENTDIETSNIYSELIKWIMAQKGNKHHVTQAFDDAVTCGIGWITADVMYNRDLINGDIVVGNASPFSILPDPLAKEMDLSDAKYVLRYSWLTKTDLKALYPEADIKELKEEQPTEEYIQQPKAKGGKRVLVIEKWYRDYVKKTIMVDPETTEVIEVDDEDHKVQLLMQYPNAKFITRNVPTVKLMTVTRDGSLLYDGGNPHGTDTYPFFPVYGYYSPSFNELSLRTQGMIRILKDPQREKNKRRSQSMYAVMSLPFGGMLIEKGFVDDPKAAFNTRVGGMKIIEFNPGKEFKQLTAPDLPSALVQLEQMSDIDMQKIGVNPDLLGEQMSKSEPGINIQMRQKQGMAAIQEFFDNLSYAKQNLGNYIISLINENFTDTKVSRILGREVPQGFIDGAKDVLFDTIVDEIADSPSTRMATFTTLSNLKQQGAAIPDEIMVELLEGVSKETKEKILEPMRLQRELMTKQMQQQIQQMQMQEQQAQAQQLQPVGMQPQEMPQPEQPAPVEGMPMDINQTLPQEMV